MLFRSDGSESLSYTFSGLAAGSTIVAASGTYAVNGSGQITIAASDLASASLHLPTTVSGHISIGVVTTATEGLNGATASSTSATLDLNVVDKSTSTDLGGENLNNIIGTTAANNQAGTAAADRFVGMDGNDTQTGAAGADVLDGGAGADSLVGGAGADTLWGGSGNDTMTGGTESDTFSWTLADRGTAGTPAADVITDFDAAAASAGGDVLDLKDLLVGEWRTSSANNLDRYLDFDTTTTPGQTLIRISTTGGFTNGVYDATKVDQTINLSNLNLRTALSLSATATDAQVIQELLNRNKLLTDSGS